MSAPEAPAPVSIGKIAGMLLRGEITTASFTAGEYVALVNAVKHKDWNRISEERFAVRLKSGRWRTYTWRKHDPDEDGNVVSIEAVGWL